MKLFLFFLVIVSHQLFSQAVRSNESLWDQIRLNSNLQYDSDRSEIANASETVSYTHLTLPTIDPV